MQDASFSLPSEGLGNVLTDLKIKNLPIQGKRHEEPDGKIGGLYLIVQPTGAKSWAVRYRAGGKPRKLTIGAYPNIDLATARRRAQEALGDVAGGKDPAGAKKAAREARKTDREVEANRLDKVAATYVERYVKREVGAAWGAEIERQIRVEIVPKLGKRHIGAITKSDVLDLLDEIVDRGSPITANRVHATLRQLFNWALDRDMIKTSPMPKSAPATETARDRVLSEDEIRVVWRALESIDWPFGPIGKLLLLTGARRVEIAAGTWAEIDFEAKLWTIPAVRIKNGEAHEIPLSREALEILTGLRRIASKQGFVFTTTGQSPVSGFSRAKRTIDAAVVDILKENRGEQVETLAHWTLHDLRRTVATNLQQLGVKLEVTEAVLNHVSGSRAGIVGVYQRYKYTAEKRQALDAWARRLEAIVGGAEASNVVEMKARG
jgi:integrase